MLRRYLTRWIDLKSNCLIWDKETLITRLIEQVHHLFYDFYFDNRIIELYSNMNTIEDIWGEDKKEDIWNMKNMKLILNSL